MSPTPRRTTHAKAARQRRRHGLQHLPGWRQRGNQIARTFMREDFAHAMVFVNQVATAAEAGGYHLDVDLRWNMATMCSRPNPRTTGACRSVAGCGWGRMAQASSGSR
jgi:pterin-4a-carbinolamine dehydratase